MKLGCMLAVMAGVLAAVAEEAAPRLMFKEVFAPSEGFVNRLEKPLREEICLNGRWDFQAVAVPKEWKHGKGQAPELTPPSADAWDSVKIKIPSPWNINDFCFRKLAGPDHRNFPSYPESWNGVQMAWMRRRVLVPADWAGRSIALRFEAVAGQAVVLANGRKVAENFDLFLPFEADVTSVCKPGEEMEILVGVRSQRLFEDNSTVGRRLVPAGSMFGTAMNGIWQDVYLLARPKLRVADVFVKPQVAKGVLALDVTLANEGGACVAELDATVNEWLNLANTEDALLAPVPAWELGAERLAAKFGKVELGAGETKTASFEIPVAKGALKLWTPEHPALSALQLSVRVGGATADRKFTRFGWREWTIDGAKHLLNGEPYALRGDSWHFMGVPQMTRRYAWAWFKAIKAMNGNAVRLHAQVYPSFYHDMADEMGICILDETANWASDGGPKVDSPIFWEHSLDHLERFVKRDRNHPSVFGWSVSNENKPVILYVFSRPDLMPQQKEAWVKWRDLVTRTDPTRPWISSDGEEDGEGILPVTVGHYGDRNSMKNWLGIGKPWGIGETSMAYYGTPAQIAKVNGERAYESMLGRMEGLATECYGLIRDQREAGASYACVFNMAWYALKPQPFGLRDLTREPTLDDGVFFGEYVEGRPGIQPERMGPYCSTFNPGYDPALPLWDAWPMFDAIRAANAPSGAAWSPWAEAKADAATEAAPAARRFAEVFFSGAAGGKLRAAFEAQGVEFVETVTKPAEALLVVDGSKAPGADEIGKLAELSKGGAEIWIWGLVPETLEAYRPLIGEGLELFPLKRSSFLPQRKPLTAGLVNSDFYFCELQRADVARYTLGGAWVARSQVLLEACRTDWRRWNQQAEEIKTAGILRSERECTVPLASIVRGCNGFAPVTVFALEDFANSERGYKTLGRMLGNAGVPRREIKEDPAEVFFLRDGRIMFPSVTRDRLKQVAKDKHTFTFWTYSPRALDDLLIEPNMPKVTLWLKSREGATLRINGVDVKIGWKSQREVEFKEIPLKQGWNKMEVEVNGPRHEFQAEYRCGNKPEFLPMMKNSLKEQN